MDGSPSLVKWEWLQPICGARPRSTRSPHVVVPVRVPGATSRHSAARSRSTPSSTTPTSRSPPERRPNRAVSAVQVRIAPARRGGARSRAAAALVLGAAAAGARVVATAPRLNAWRQRCPARLGQPVDPRRRRPDRRPAGPVAVASQGDSRLGHRRCRLGVGVAHARLSHSEVAREAEALTATRRTGRVGAIGSRQSHRRPNRDRPGRTPPGPDPG
jgi:hypothetical protein